MTLPLDFVLLIPCYNNAEGLTTSLQSISYAKNKFEVLIVDDGSILPIDESELQKIFRGMTIRVIRLERNGGIVKALNTGLSSLKLRMNVKYIARLDAGDTCAEQRFYKQVAVLDIQPDIALLGSWARFENKHGNKGYDYITQTIHETILKEMHYKCSFVHPSVMFRKIVLDEIGFYPETYLHAEDYAFFWEILKRYKGAVLPEKLVKINFSDKSVSNENYKKQLLARKKVVKRFGNNGIDRLTGIMLINLKLMLPKSFINLLKLTFVKE